MIIDWRWLITSGVGSNFRHERDRQQAEHGSAHEGLHGARPP
jgi:hypothetical protein